MNSLLRGFDTVSNVNGVCSLAIEMMNYQKVAAMRERYYTLVPVLTKRDRPMVQQLLRIGRQIIDEWLSSNYDRVKAELAGIAPVHYGVPFTIAFTEIWHYIFGATNRHLVEEGFFADPYSETRRFKGFIPAVWEPSLNKVDPR